MARRSVNTTDLIPIYYRIPFGDQKEIVSGYLEKKHVDGGKRFYGHFTCEDCGHDWRSGHTWEGYRQECNKCYVKNWPEEVYHLEQSTGLISAEPHREDLCEKCQKLGHNCQETHGFGGIGSGRNNKFDQCFNKQFELWRYNILLEPQFIQDLYDSLWDDLNPSDRSEFKDALEFALGNWKAKGNDDQITACEDLLWKIEDASQRKSRTRKRSASSNRSLSPMDPGTIHNTCIPLNNEVDALLWYDEDTSPRTSLSPGRTAPSQPIESSPRPTVWNAAQVKRGFNQTTSISTVYPVQMPVTKTNHRDDHSTPQLINDTVSDMASRVANTTDLIPIYYRIPFGDQKEIVAGYLEKKHVDGGKRFYGHFTCEDCGHDWRSGHTWEGYRQECNKCYVKNWPEEVYHLEQSTGLISAEPHREDLCEKCQELGHNCQETHEFGGIRFSRNNKFDQCFNKQFELWRYNILLEPQFIQDLYDSLWDDLNPSDRSEFKDALEFALGNWKAKGNDDQITACEDLLWKIEDPSQRKSRTRKRSASSNRSLSPMDPETIHNPRIPLNNEVDALLWYDEDTSPRTSLSPGRTAPNQPIESSPIPTVWKPVDIPDTSPQVKQRFNQTTYISSVHPVQIPVTRTNYRDECSTSQSNNATLEKPKMTLVPQTTSKSIHESVLSQTNNSSTAQQTSNNKNKKQKFLVLPNNNPIIQLDSNSPSRPKNNPAPQPTNKSSGPKNNSAPQPKNKSSGPKNNPAPQPTNKSSGPKNNPAPQPTNKSSGPKNNSAPQPTNKSSGPKNNPAPQPTNKSSGPKNNPAPQPTNKSSGPKNNPAPQPTNKSSGPKNNPAPQPTNKSSGPKNNPTPQPNNNPSPDPNNSLTVESDEDPVRILSMLTVIILAVAMLVYFTVL